VADELAPFEYALLPVESGRAISTAGGNMDTRSPPRRPRLDVQSLAPGGSGIRPVDPDPEHAAGVLAGTAVDSPAVAARGRGASIEHNGAMHPGQRPPVDGYTVPAQGDAYLAHRIPDGEPLVLRPRLSRFVLVFGTIYLGVPAALFGVATVALLVMTGDHWRDVVPIVGIAAGALIFLGALQLLMMASIGMSGGPYLGAGPAGIWIRARKWPAKAVFLPWPAVDRVYTRRWLFDRMICVQAADPRAGAGAGALARVDMGMQRLLFGARLTASTFYCGRRVDDVLAELRRLSAGQVPIG
jgi:hypothetical protein